MAVRTKTHPGEILSEEFLKPLSISARAFAQTLDLIANRVSEIVRGRARV